MKSGHLRKLGWPFFFVCAVARGARLVAAEPPFGGERGSLPRTFCVVGTAPHGYRGQRGAWRRHLAVRDRAEGARLVRDCAGAQPRSPPTVGPAVP
jgi:hypothetical protein